MGEVAVTKTLVEAAPPPPPPAAAGLAMASPIRVTPPIRANARPARGAPAAKLIDWFAMILPFMPEPLPIVAELPTCQNTLAACAPPMRMTCRPEVVTKVEVIWKIKTALTSPWPSSGRSPDEIGREKVDV